MTADRTRGAVLYTLTAALLGAGTFWWFAAAPGQPRDARTAEWSSVALLRLPDDAAHVKAGTVPLAAGAEHEVLIPLDAGPYQVTMVCVGGADSEVRVHPEASGGSYGQNVGCAEEDQPVSFHLSTAGELRLRLVVTDTGPVVVRYSVQRSES